jgi:hypothetical protein
VTNGFAVLPDALAGIVGSQARESRLLIEIGPVYQLFTHRLGEDSLRFEVVGSGRLPPELKLSSARASRLRELGFSKRDGARRNWIKTVEQIDYRALTDEAAEIFHQVYGVSETPRIALTEDDREHPQNPDLYAAMRTVARGFDEATRRAMYTELLNAVLLVPLEGERTDDADLPETAPYHVFETLHDRPVIGVFSDWASLRLWEPRGWEYRAVHGSELFENAAAQNVASVRINPGGDVGGELYRHEVDMLVDVVHRFRRENFN